jgi:hypothetical protein
VVTVQAAVIAAANVFAIDLSLVVSAVRTAVLGAIAANTATAVDPVVVAAADDNLVAVVVAASVVFVTAVVIVVRSIVVHFAFLQQL